MDDVREAIESENQALADVAECASPVAHEMNNFLNALLLHLAVLETQLPADQRPGLEQIRREGNAMATLVHQWQNYRRRRIGDPACDLNLVVRAALDQSSTRVGGPNIRAGLSDTPVSVRGPLAELVRLCRFLVRNAVAVTPTDGTVTVRTARSDGRGVLRVEDAGPTVAPDQLSGLLTAHPVGRTGTNGLELAACKSIVRRLHGTITAENRGGGGVVVTVELPAAGGLT
jgi:signal transduction histidine kinase